MECYTFQKARIQDILDMLPEPPEENCSCHIAPPCSDCVDNGGLRELREELKSIIEG